MAPVSGPRLAGAARFLRLFLEHAVSIATTFLLVLSRRFRGKGGQIPRVNNELNDYSSLKIYQLSNKLQRWIEVLLKFWPGPERSSMC